MKCLGDSDLIKSFLAENYLNLVMTLKNLFKI